MGSYVLLSAGSNPSSPPCRPSPPPPIAGLLHPPVAKKKKCYQDQKDEGEPTPSQPHLIWDNFQQRLQKSRMTCNLEAVTMIAEIGQQQ